ncbi:MAG: hypothetical protein M8861_08755 [marine benthic group bacterium]|nr:hypothetical protein [Gemmatimonadota bacterium]
MTNNTGDRPSQRRLTKATVASVIAGIVVFALLLTAGVAVAQRTTTQWIARSSALVLPSQPVSPEQLPGYYETLSRGQIVATLAELVRLGEFQAEVADGFELSESQREFVQLEVNVVADTAMLRVVATSEDPNLAIAMVDGVVEEATTYIGDLVLPYALVPVSSGASNLTESGLSTPIVIGIFGLVALVAGVAVQQAVFHLARLNERRRENRATPSSNDSAVPKPPTTETSTPEPSPTAKTKTEAATSKSKSPRTGGKATKKRPNTEASDAAEH